MSDEELAKKKKEHPGLFSEPHTNHVTKISPGKKHFPSSDWKIK